MRKRQDMRRKGIRLGLENYQTLHVYYLTINCFGRAKQFAEKSLVAHCLDELRKLSHAREAKVWAYCFMPDHLHLLIETENCLQKMKLFKQITGYYFKQKSGKVLWQKSFYDHILRKEEDLIGAMKYILNNPVRAGLVRDYLDYPYSGSFEMDIEDFVAT